MADRCDRGPATAARLKVSRNCWVEVLRGTGSACNVFLMEHHHSHPDRQHHRHRTPRDAARLTAGPNGSADSPSQNADPGRSARASQGLPRLLGRVRDGPPVSGDRLDLDAGSEARVTRLRPAGLPATETCSQTSSHEVRRHCVAQVERIEARGRPPRMPRSASAYERHAPHRRRCDGCDAHGADSRDPRALHHPRHRSRARSQTQHRQLLPLPRPDARSDRQGRPHPVLGTRGHRTLDRRLPPRGREPETRTGSHSAKHDPARRDPRPTRPGVSRRQRTTDSAGRSGSSSRWCM